MEIIANNSRFIFLPDKDVLGFHFDSLKQKFNHLKVKEVVDIIPGVPDLWANYICEIKDAQKIEQTNE